MGEMIGVIVNKAMNEVRKVRRMLRLIEGEIRGPGAVDEAIV